MDLLTENYARTEDGTFKWEIAVPSMIKCITGGEYGLLSAEQEAMVSTIVNRVVEGCRDEPGNFDRIYRSLFLRADGLEGMCALV